MNERIRELAEQAGFVMWSDCDWKPRGEVIDWSSNYDKELEKFARLVAEKEREACFKGQAEHQEPVSELLKLMAEDGVTGVLIEVHRGRLSKSVRTWGDCSCPTHTDSDTTIEVQP